MNLTNYFNKFKKLYYKYEKVILSVSFFIGLFWDNLTLRRPDMPYENAVFVWNLFQAAFLMALINIFNAGRLKGKVAERVIPFLPIFLQASFGNLFSGFIVFYIRSGSIFSSWPFILLLGILFVGNEFFRKRYSHLPFQAGVLFIAVFSYFAFALPVLLNKIGDLVFLLSGALSLIITLAIVFMIIFGAKSGFKKSAKYVFATLGSIFLVFNILYFTNVIPPIPLVSKDIEMFHSIQPIKQGNYIYQVTFEPGNHNFPFFEEESSIFHIAQDKTIYAFSAIFSPADLNVPIFHHWMRFDETAKKWVEVAKVSFGITGGRALGYRGYSYILNAVPGKWRVDVMTETGQTLGRKNFTVITSESAPVLESGLR
jgi:hypothetical protein